MELTAKQKEAVKIAVKRYRDGEKMTVISGYAGAGKSTVVSFIIAALDLDEMDVAYATFTGKAAQVLKDKGNPGATTLHKLLYYNTQMANGSYMRRRKESLGVSVIVIDEVSMVPTKMIQDLLSYPVYLICCGDPGQLPPISKNDDNHLLDHPHVFLDEIMRQAKESEIIQVSMQIRDGEPLKEFYGKEVQIFNAADLTEGMLTWADVTLCATNKKRIGYNNNVRKQLGYSGELLVPGERLICLHNYDDKVSDSEEASLTNGTIGTVENIREYEVVLPYWLKESESERIIPCYKVDLRLDNNDIIRDVIVEKQMLATGTSVLTGSDLYKLRKNKRFHDPLPNDVAYGYVITTHKSQGSQFDKVLVIEEGFPFENEEHKRWLYTAVTRAVDKLVIIKKD